MSDCKNCEEKQAMVMHLLQSGQVSQSMLQKLPPAFRQMLGR